MLQTILLVINLLVCVALIIVVLMQRSEGGALGMGGGPSGFMSVRGAGDFLTRTTWILFSIFLGLSLILTLMGGGSGSVTDRMKVQRLDPASMNQQFGPGGQQQPGATPPGSASTQTTPIPGLIPGAPPAPPGAALTPTTPITAPAAAPAPVAAPAARQPAQRPAQRPAAATPATPPPAAPAEQPAPVISAPPPAAPAEVPANP